IGILDWSAVGSPAGVHSGDNDRFLHCIDSASAASVVAPFAVSGVLIAVERRTATTATDGGRSMSSREEVERVADELVRVAAAGDLDGLRRLYTADATICHNTDDADKSVEDSLRFLGGLRAVCTRVWYEDQRRTLTDSGFVLQHYTCAELGDGQQ